MSQTEITQPCYGAKHEMNYHLFIYAIPSVTPVVPKLGVNYPPGVICDSSGAQGEPKPQCCSVLWAITVKYWG